MKRCKDCKHWDKATVEYFQWGRCNAPIPNWVETKGQLAITLDAAGAASCPAFVEVPDRPRCYIVAHLSGSISSGRATGSPEWMSMTSGRKTSTVDWRAGLATAWIW